jgi:hypothetical protein
MVFQRIRKAIIENDQRKSKDEQSCSETTSTKESTPESKKRQGPVLKAEKYGNQSFDAL